jgi:hypothetical protein
MSHLVEEYAKSCGVKIGIPKINPHFFPVVEDRYITIHNDKKVESKEYSYWPQVIELIKPILSKKNIKIIQIGSSGEATINGVDKHIVTNTLKQCSFIIKNSLAHVGIDSVPVHIASAFDKPIVSIYSHTYAATCKPYWNKKSKTICIESHRGGNKPSFSIKENIQTINFIYPEKIANSLLEVLDINEKINFETILIGERFNQKFLDVIPSKKTLIFNETINVRMDHCHNEDVLEDLLLRNNVEITTNKIINDRILNSKKIRCINYIADEFDVDFVKKIKKLGINHILLCSKEENLSDERKKLFDFQINSFNQKEIIESNKLKLKNVDLNKVKFYSNKKIICGDQVYDSLFEFYNKRNDSDFFIDLDWFYVYNENYER